MLVSLHSPSSGIQLDSMKPRGNSRTFRLPVLFGKTLALTMVFLFLPGLFAE
jgi:hypothetical protein